MFFYSCILLALASAVKGSVIVNVFEADGEMKASHSLDGCNASDCDRFCRSAGFRKGSCVNNRCRCTSFLELTENKADYPVHSCNYQACDQLCRRLGFPGGACVGDKCDCDNFEPIEIKGKALDFLLKRTNKETDEDIEVEDKKDSNSEKHSRKLTSLIDVLRAAVGHCDVVQCNDMCHRLKYAGGMCIGGSCQCY